MIIKLTLSFATTLMSAAPAFAACTGLSILANNLNLEWDFNWTMLAVNITVNKTDPGACTFGLGFSQGGAGSYVRFASQGGSQLKYQLYKDSAANNILKDVPDIASGNDVIMVTLPPGNNPLVVQYYFDIPYSSATSPTLAAAGIFTDSFMINAYEGPDHSSLVAPPSLSEQVNVTITVPKLVNLALVDTGGVFQETATSKSIEFGNLVTGQAARFDMRVRTNAGYSITMSSANNGQMKHTTKDSFVPYQLLVNGSPADLTGTNPVATGNGQTTMEGLGYPVRVIIGTVGPLALAGPYQDTVVITATATE